MRKIKINNAVYKIGAVILAILLWFYVLQAQNPVSEQIFANIPVEMRNLADGLVVAEQVEQVTVRVRGAKDLLNEMQTANIKPYMDFSGASVGAVSKKIEVSLPPAVQLVSIDPISVNVEIEEIHTVQVPVEMELLPGPVAPGFTSLAPSYTPSKVFISGAKGVLDSVDKVFVQVDLTDAVENYHESLPLLAKDKNGELIKRGLEIKPEGVEVLIPVVADEPSKMVPLNYTIIGTPAVGYGISRVIMEPSFINIYGDYEVISQINQVQTAPIDVSGASGTVNRTVEVLVTDKFNAKTTKTVKVIVQVEEMVTRTVGPVLIDVKNASENVNIALSQSTAQVDIKGPKSFVEAVTEADIKLYVDVLYLSVDNYSLELKAEVPPNVSLQMVNPREILVNISSKSQQ